MAEFLKKDEFFRSEFFSKCSKKSLEVSFYSSSSFYNQILTYNVFKNSEHFHDLLFSMCDRIGLNRLNMALPLRKWISRGMTGIFRSSKLFAKVMDKVVAGSVKVLVFVALSLVDVSRQKIADSDDAYDAVAKISSIETEEMEAKIITLALERWAKDQQRASSNTHHTDTFDSNPSQSFLGTGLQIRDNFAKPNFSLSNKIVVDDEDEL